MPLLPQPPSVVIDQPLNATIALDLDNRFVKLFSGAPNPLQAALNYASLLVGCERPPPERCPGACWQRAPPTSACWMPAKRPAPPPG